MPGHRRNKILVGGDQTAAKRFVGPANSQMELLKKQMSFQNRSQGVRRVWLHDDVYVECVKCFNYQECKIWVQPQPQQRELYREEPYFILIVASPSGDEAFAWNILKNELYVEKDSLKKVTAKVGDGVLAESAGEYSRDQYLWDYRLSPGGSLTTITPRPGLEDEPRVVQHPDTTARILLIEPLAFGENNDSENENCAGSDFHECRRKWEHEDQVVLSTSSGSSTVTMESKSTAEGEFNTDYAYVDAADAIDQTWTVTVYEDPNAPEKRFISAVGDTLGAIKDFQYYDIGRSCYPLTPSEVASGEDGFWLSDIGFQYELVDGNYVIDNDNTLAPVVYHWHGRSSSIVSSLKSEYESLTGEAAPNDDEMERRTQLFYIPILGWRWTKTTFGPNLNWLNYRGHGIDQILDSWADSNYSGGSPDNDGHLYVTTGRVEDQNIVCVYDSFHLLMNDTHQNGVHVFVKCPESVVLSTLEKEIFDAVNSARADNGLGAVRLCLATQWAAKRHADDMAANYEYYKSLSYGDMAIHEGTDGSNVAIRVYEAGYYDFWRMRLTPAGEILQWIEEASTDFDGDFVVNSEDGWMNSPAHRAVILETSDDMWEGETWRDTGIAHSVAEDGTNFFCQTFGFLSEERAGFSPMPADGLSQYITDNFNWAGSGDDTRVPAIYLVQESEKWLQQ